MAIWDVRIVSITESDVAVYITVSAVSELGEISQVHTFSQGEDITKDIIIKRAYDEILRRAKLTEQAALLRGDIDRVILSADVVNDKVNVLYSESNLVPVTTKEK